MSWVANVMLSVDMEEDPERAIELSEWLRARREGYLTCLTDPVANLWGGFKQVECELWAGTVNNADLDALRQRVSEIPWQEPNMVQLFVRDQQESFFRIWMIRDGELRQYAPLKPDEDDDGFYHA